MPTVFSGLSFGSFLSAFPLPILLSLVSFVFLATGKFARTTRISRTFLTGFWIVCWTAACVIALTTWQMQRSWLHTEALSSGYGTVAYYEQNGYTAAQAVHYHAVALMGMNGFQRMHNQSLGAMGWYGMLFLLLPILMYWIDRRRAQTLGAAISAGL
jgi:hypothetical protein